MSITCSLTPIYSFPSAASFTVLDADLTHKLSSKQLTAMAAPALPNVSAAYHCADCQQIWVLSEPDNAWRGFFLPQTEAMRHLQHMQKATTTRRLGCLVMVAFIILLLIWRNWH